MAGLCEGGNEPPDSLKARVLRISSQPATIRFRRDFMSSTGDEYTKMVPQVKIDRVQIRKFQLHTEQRPQIVSSTELLSIVRSRNMLPFSSDERAFNIESYFRTEDNLQINMTKVYGSAREKVLEELKGKMGYQQGEIDITICRQHVMNESDGIARHMIDHLRLFVDIFKMRQYQAEHKQLYHFPSLETVKSDEENLTIKYRALLQVVTTEFTGSILPADARPVALEPDPVARQPFILRTLPVSWMCRLTPCTKWKCLVKLFLLFNDTLSSGRLHSIDEFSNIEVVFLEMGLPHIRLTIE
ncbi:hypothetical protein ANN_27357 [Periplaneta americana]|uniref:Uncharacterized protein n=1 Tax=Periplaneta americana TaxID=6978 RepID=A0ABQ8RXZ5_PERAM|nr:hypothetical protein ANN_27357 [Periplaneta americana]